MQIYIIELKEFKTTNMTDADKTLELLLVNIKCSVNPSVQNELWHLRFQGNYSVLFNIITLINELIKWDNELINCL